MPELLVSYWSISDWEGLPGGWRSGRKGVAGNVSARVGHSVCFYCCEKKKSLAGVSVESGKLVNTLLGLIFSLQVRFFEVIFLIQVLVRGKRFFSAAWSERGRFSCSVS